MWILTNNLNWIWILNKSMILNTVLNVNQSKLILINSYINVFITVGLKLQSKTSKRWKAASVGSSPVTERSFLGRSPGFHPEILGTNRHCGDASGRQRHPQSVSAPQGLRPCSCTAPPLERQGNAVRAKTRNGTIYCCSSSKSWTNTSIYANKSYVNEFYSKPH